jgi:hypothetical protein
MSTTPRGYSTLVGMGIVLFVVLVGALGYTYVLNYKAEVATLPTTGRAIAAQTVTVPQVNESKDLDAALATLDAASVDQLSSNDLSSLEAELNNL